MEVVRCASSGGLLRDHCSKWVAGVTRNIGRTTAEEAELWGIYDGLTLAWEMGFRPGGGFSSSSSVDLRLRTAGTSFSITTVIEHFAQSKATERTVTI
ncbi:hypothetical protein PVK06_030973 [Gossypium arboreum]|uniref:RNase H type-1 domain-containing protein n=1 Tax=Gossypium arboreum TaxID=29729 RepID=A0ABR0NPR7_GOSAR|nr:hypothetical protein PVK06_030973 [Gossypium arboreum]